jgi:hypothetical protein
MRRLCIAAALLIAAHAVALAEPCQVTFARAPDEVRKVIEQWVRAEPRCMTTLELRVIPTDGGLYLMARDATGRTHERLVPDAQSAGVLVASWIADDSARPAGPPTDPNAAGPAGGPPVDAAANPADAAPSNAPGATPPSSTAAPATAPATVNASPPALGAPTAVTEAAPARPTVGRWLSLGIMGGERGGGVRGEFDVLTRGKWTLAAAAAISTWDVDLYSFTGDGLVEATDVRALATIARTIPRNRWSLRFAGGLGLVHTSVTGQFAGRPLDASGVFGTAEASAMIARRLGERWALTGGAVLTWYAQQYTVMSTDPFTEPDITADRSADLMFLIGARRRM